MCIAVNFLVMEPLFNATGAWLGCHEPACGYTTVGWSLAIAGTSCLMSFFCSLGLAWMDKRRNRYIRRMFSFNIL